MALPRYGQAAAPADVGQRWRVTCHRIMESQRIWVGRDPKAPLIPALPRAGHFQHPRVLRAPFNLPWTCTRIASPPFNSQITHSSPYLRQTMVNTPELNSKHWNLQRRIWQQSELALAIHRADDLTASSHGSAPSPSPGALPSPRQCLSAVGPRRLLSRSWTETSFCFPCVFLDCSESICSMAESLALMAPKISAAPPADAGPLPKHWSPVCRPCSGQGTFPALCACV